MDDRNANNRPSRKEYGNLAGTQDWYLVLNPKGTKEIPVREIDLAGREKIAGPYETRGQAMCERMTGEYLGQKR